MICPECGKKLGTQISCHTCCMSIDVEPLEHYHVVAFINGCLNDHDSGPYDTLDDARIALAEYVETDSDTMHDWISAGVDRFVQRNGVYIAAIESCSEAECYGEI